MNRGVISFQLFGIPVAIQPISWLLLAFLGGAFNISGAADLYPVLIFMVVGMVSIIAHEMGHALAGRHWLGSSPSIEIVAFGGETRNDHIRMMSRPRFFAMVFAGPLLGLLPALLALLVLCIQMGDWGACWSFARVSTFSLGCSEQDYLSAITVLEHLMSPHSGIPSVLYHLYTSFFFVGFWWTLLNLLPIFPLDGGKLVATLLNNFKLSAVIGIVFSLLFLAFALYCKSVYTTVFACYFVYLNWQHFQAYRSMRG